MIDDANSHVARLADGQIGRVVARRSTRAKKEQLGERLAWLGEHHDQYRSTNREDQNDGKNRGEGTFTIHAALIRTPLLINVCLRPKCVQTWLKKAH